MANENIPSYIGKLKCGCVISACVDDGKNPEMVKEFLTECIKEDEIIERTTVGWVREHGFEKCQAHKIEQPALFAEVRNG
ncbi:MAG: hypothetical protein ABFD24_09510 [Anaerolineaceae bacterium]